MNQHAVRPPHRWMVTRALFRRQTRRISQRFRRHCARRVGPGEPIQSRPATSYKTLSLCVHRPKCGESGASKELHARALSGEAPGLGVRTGASRGAASPVVRLIGRCRRVGRQTRMRCHGCTEVATTRHPLTGACGRLRRYLALEAGLAPGLRGRGAHRLLGLRPAPSPANSTPPGVTRRPTITGGRSAFVHPTQGVEPRRCGDGCAFWLLAWHAPDPRRRRSRPWSHVFHVEPRSAGRPTGGQLGRARVDRHMQARETAGPVAAAKTVSVSRGTRRRIGRLQT